MMQSNLKNRLVGENRASNPPICTQNLAGCWRETALRLAILAILYSPVSYANPDGAQIISGQVSIDTATPGVTTVTNSPNAIINWQNFNIAQNELTQFIQQNGQSAVLNRIIGQNPSEILGQLTSNGKVFLINPNGIVFGAGAVIDTQGLIASSLNISDQDFLSGNYHFMAGSKAGNIVNEGIIRAGKDGNIVLIAPQIQNSGIIQSDGGSITLAAGQELTITNLDNPDIRFQIQAPIDSVLNLGKLLTEGGAINVFAGTIKHSGEINADSVELDAQGNIRLVAQQDISLESGSKISANNSQGDAGAIHIESKTGTTLAQGTIEAQASGSASLKANKGGTIKLLGEQVGVLDQAKIDASGKNGGGQVLIGGDYQGKNAAVHNAKAAYVGKDTTIKADAKTDGNGGKIIVWSDQATRAYGDLSAKGGSLGGNGGFIETSGHWLDVEGIKIDTSSANGQRGNWLLDPTDIYIAVSQASATGAGMVGTDSSANTGPSIFLVTGSPAGSLLRTGTLSTALNTSNASVGASGNIIVVDNVTKTAGGASTLYLKADNAIVIKSGVGIRSTSGALNVTFNADADGSGAGNIDLNNGSFINSNGGTVDLGGGSGGYAVGTAGNPTNRGIRLNNAVIDASGGNILLKGKGVNTASSNNFGVDILNGSVVKTFGTGAITINGIGSGSGSGNWGVNINGATTVISTVNGAINITGLGSNGGDYNNYGILFNNGAMIYTTGTGAINITGTGGASSSGTSTGGEHGVFIDSNSTINSLNGAINIIGNAGTSLSGANIGTIVNGDITSTGSGAISVKGMGTGTGEGLLITSKIGQSGALGNISLIASAVNGIDSINILAPAMIAGSGQLFLQPNAVTDSIGLAGGTGNFNLSAADFGYIQNGFSNIIIGNSTGTGAINLGAGNWTVPSLSNLTLQNAGAASGGIALNGALTLSAGKNLTLNSSGTINASQAVNVGGVFTLSSGTWSQIGATLPSLSAADFVIGSNATFIRALGGDGSIGNPYQLTDVYGLQGMGSLGMPGKNYTLGNDIDASTTGAWNANAGFLPVGDATTKFSGNFNGQNHIITGLTINRPLTSNVGLFGATGSTSVISNVGLLGGSMAGTGNVGALVGNNQGAVSYSYATGNVTGTGSGVGGLVGIHGFGAQSASIDNSYTTGNVSGDFKVGGLVGYQEGSINNSYASGNVTGRTGTTGGLLGENNWGKVNYSYATGNVNAPNAAGGLVGHNTNAGALASKINHSFASGTVTGATNVGGLVGAVAGSITADSKALTAAEMRQMTTFSNAGWSIANVGGSSAVWRIYDGQTGPLLRSFLTPLTVTANNDSRPYDGLAYTGGNGASYSIVDATPQGALSYSGDSQGAIDAGSYVITPGGLYSAAQNGYDISYIDGTLDITSALLNILRIKADNATRVYGDANPVFTGNITFGGLAGRDTLSSIGLTYTTLATPLSDAGTYAITPKIASKNYAFTGIAGQLTVTSLASVAWTGGDGDWSTAGNWANNILPTSNNVLAATIPAGVTVTYDAVAGNTKLDSLNSLGHFQMTGGRLGIKGNFNTAQYTQSGGELFADNFLASRAFTQTGGALTANNIAINTINNLIQGLSGSINTTNLKANSGGHVALAGSNSVDGVLDISANDNLFSRTRKVSRMSGLSALNGWIDVENIGGFILGSTVLDPGTVVANASGNIMIKAKSPLTVNGAISSSGGSVNLTASNGDALTINAPVSGTGGIALAGGTLSGSNADLYKSYFLINTTPVVTTDPPAGGTTDPASGGATNSTDTTTDGPVSETVTDSTTENTAVVVGTTTQSGQPSSDKTGSKDGTDNTDGSTTSATEKGKKAKQCAK